MRKSYKIAYVSSWNPDDKQSWSGTLYSMKKALEKEGVVEWIDARSNIFDRISLRLVWVYGYVIEFWTGKEYEWTRNPFLTYMRGYLIRKELNKSDYDFIFAPASSNEVACLDSTIPIIYISDATFAAYNELYKTTLNVHKQEKAHVVEQKALDKAAIVSFPSQWAVDSAIRDYDILKEKIHLNRFGSNFQNLTVNQGIKDMDLCRIFFLGVDWMRKGGDIVVEACDVLIARGVKVELTVCGCDLPAEYAREYITHIPFLDKNNDEDERQLIAMFHKAHFFFMPSQGECYGIVYAEASSAGVPSIACNVGGVASVVTPENGCLLPGGSTPEEYAETIDNLFKQQDKYQALSKSARLFYEEKLDWSIWSNEIITAFDELDKKGQ